MSEVMQMEQIKEIIRQLHAGAAPEEVKEKFKEILKGVTPVQIAQIEQALIDEGMPAEEVRALCDVHLLVFQDSFGAALDVTEGHPLHTFLEEHRRILVFLERLKRLVEKVKQAGRLDPAGEDLKLLRQIAQHLLEVENHQVREENVLFPYLEKYGIKEPPKIMWSEHNEMREMKKQLKELSEQAPQLPGPELARRLAETALPLADFMEKHITKENNILYPAALRVIAPVEWTPIREECDNLGYCCFSPAYVRDRQSADDGGAAPGELAGKAVRLPTGNFTVEELEGVLNALPVDITFVDIDDRVKYFNQPADRFFPRTKAVIGRKVQFCHPEKSVHQVNQILEHFRGKQWNKAEFWINMNDRKIYIRYFPVYDRDGAYLGCLEVTQDITDVQKIEGEKRLL
jgi:uncharacterized protein